MKQMQMIGNEHVVIHSAKKLSILHLLFKTPNVFGRLGGRQDGLAHERAHHLLWQRKDSQRHVLLSSAQVDLAQGV